MQIVEHTNKKTASHYSCTIQSVASTLKGARPHGIEVSHLVSQSFHRTYSLNYYWGISKNFITTCSTRNLDCTCFRLSNSSCGVFR